MTYQLDWNIPLDCVSKETLLQKLTSGENIVLVDTIGTFDGNKYKIKGAVPFPTPKWLTDGTNCSDIRRSLSIASTRDAWRPRKQPPP